MRILVVYGNIERMEVLRPIFQRLVDRYAATVVYIPDANIDLERQPNLTAFYDVVFSVHCRKKFPKEVVEKVRCINLHPGYNPYNRGMFPHVWSIINDLPAGVTIHEMDEEIDNGKILVREQVFISEADTSETLYAKILQLEARLLSENIDAIINNTIKGFEPEHKGNYNTLADFKKLCVISPNTVGTFKEFYNLLRALSHGEYKNAQYKSTYIKLNIYDRET